ncbi:MAG TPA: GtrA family protein [Sphingomonas sp.]|nr:GtrA family protein [Sphingomonas sp.]
MTAIIHRIGELQRSGVLGQLVRFGIAGVISTVIYSAVYLPLAWWVFPNLAVAAVPFAFAVAVTCGFFLHSAWSFKGHGTRENSGRQHLKFLVVQSFGLLLNALFTWLIADLMHYPDWVPLIPIVTITPVATFALNRQWVFG